jgi:hypothetical protein
VGEVEAIGSPHVGVVIIAERVHSLLPRKVLPLALELCLGDLQVHLPRVQAVRLLLKVGHVAVGTLVQQHEPMHLLRLNLASMW